METLYSYDAGEDHAPFLSVKEGHHYKAVLKNATIEAVAVKGDCDDCVFAVLNDAGSKVCNCQNGCECALFGLTLKEVK